MGTKALVPGAQQVFNEVVVGVLATINDDGSPRATPVHLVTDGKAVYWFSSEETVHSQNIEQEPKVSVTLFTSSKSAVYVSGTSAKVVGAERTAAAALLVDRLGAFPPHFARVSAYKLPIGKLDTKKSGGNCWYFYS